jgi:hypothetical protein
MDDDVMEAIVAYLLLIGFIILILYILYSLNTYLFGIAVTVGVAIIIEAWLYRKLQPKAERLRLAHKRSEPIPLDRKWLLSGDFWAAVTTGFLSVFRIEDLALRDQNGWTPLHFAANRNQDPEVIRTLVGLGADPNARDLSGCTPLHTAALFNGNPEIAKTLITLGADPNARERRGLTALQLAVRNRNPEVLETLKRVAGGAVASEPSNSSEEITGGDESAVLSTEGGTVVSQGRDETAEFWLTLDWKLIRTLEGHTGLVVPVAFSPDGSMIASGSRTQPSSYGGYLMVRFSGRLRGTLMGCELRRLLTRWQHDCIGE